MQWIPGREVRGGREKKRGWWEGEKKWLVGEKTYLERKVVRWDGGREEKREGLGERRECKCILRRWTVGKVKSKE